MNHSNFLRISMNLENSIIKLINPNFQNNYIFLINKNAQTKEQVINQLRIEIPNIFFKILSKKIGIFYYFNFENDIKKEISENKNNFFNFDCKKNFLSEFFSFSTNKFFFTKSFEISHIFNLFKLIHFFEENFCNYIENISKNHFKYLIIFLSDFLLNNSNLNLNSKAFFKKYFENSFAFKKSRIFDFYSHFLNSFSLKIELCSKDLSIIFQDISNFLEHKKLNKEKVNERILIEINKAFSKIEIFKQFKRYSKLIFYIYHNHLEIHLVREFYYIEKIFFINNNLK